MHAAILLQQLLWLSNCRMFNCENHSRWFKKWNAAQNLVCGWKIVAHLQLLNHPTGNCQTHLFVAPTDTMSFTYAQPFMNITPWHLFWTGGKYFHTPQHSSLSSQADRWPASPLCLYLSSHWPFRKNYMMAKPRYHFLVHWVRLRAPVNLACSFLVQF